MSRKPFRPTAQLAGDVTERPAEALEAAFLGRSDPARDWEAAPADLPAEPDDLPAMPKTAPEVGVPELARAHGTAGLARELGVSQRQAERYAAGNVDVSRARRATRERLHTAQQQLAAQQLGEQRREIRRARKALRDAQRDERREQGQREWGAVVARLGGVQAAATALERHPRTIERWLAGQRHPSEADRARLERADRHVRVRTAFGIHDPTVGGGAAATGPAGAGGPAGGPAGVPGVCLSAFGRVRVEGGYYEYDRNIGTQGDMPGAGGRHPLPHEVAGQLLNCLGNGDRDGALQTLEEHLSTGYAQCEGYDPNTNEGWHFLDLQQFDLVQLDGTSLGGAGDL